MWIWLDETICHIIFIEVISACHNVVAYWMQIYGTAKIFMNNYTSVLLDHVIKAVAWIANLIFIQWWK